MGGYELMRGADVVVCQVRVRSLTEDSKDTVLRDVASLNLEMFIEELVAAVVESKLKASDILAAVRHDRPGRTHPRIVGIQREHDVCSCLLHAWMLLLVGVQIQVCSALHARYEAFTSGLIPSLTSVLHSAPATGEEDKETARKKRQVGGGVGRWLVMCERRTEDRSAATEE